MFPIPHYTSLSLLQLMESSPFFKKWTIVLQKEKKRSPIYLLLLGTLRYLGHGWTFEELEESTGISQEVHRVFFTRL